MATRTLRSAALLGALALAACATPEPPPPPPPPPADIVTTAARTGEFDTLVSALRVTGVAATLVTSVPIVLLPVSSRTPTRPTARLHLIVAFPELF